MTNTDKNTNAESHPRIFDVVVVGGGPSGATVAHELARDGLEVALLDKMGRIKPCGGAVPPILLREFDVPESLLEAKVTSARMISPANQKVDMPIGGFVGMVSREKFDPWLRERASDAGASLIAASFESLQRLESGGVEVTYRPVGSDNAVEKLQARLIIGADGAASRVRKLAMPRKQKMKHVFAYHEIVRSPAAETNEFDPRRCDVYYQSAVSPDFYGWVFPHGDCTSVGTGSAVKGFSLRNATQKMREKSGLANNEIVRKEGAPLPLKPLRRWDNGRDTMLIGDAAGAVAPSSGEGIYYAMISGRLAAGAAKRFLATGKVSALRASRAAFMKQHRLVFMILGVMQYWWYGSDKRREKFVDICRDPDVQRLTWDAYMNKKLVRAKPVAHVRIFFKDLAHLIGIHPR